MADKKLNLDVQLSLPEDGIGWMARVFVLNSEGYINGRVGVGEDSDVGSAFKSALVFALASGFSPEGVSEQ